MILKGGYKTGDPRLDRVPQWDERNLNYPVRAVVPARPRSYTWRCEAHLDQGREGACVGFSWAHELTARPKVRPQTEDQARSIYREAQKIDAWPGEAYEGTSVIAGAKIVQSLGLMGEYRWAFSVEDLAYAVGHRGPAVLGVNWYSGMDSWDEGGMASVSGHVRGGHAILCNGVSFRLEKFRLHNSWGSDWGIGGHVFISFADMSRLLLEDGEACIPSKRF